MRTKLDPEATRSFLDIACSQSLLTREVAEEVYKQADAQGGAVDDLLLQKGLMDPLEVDIVETLLRPTEAFPGYEILDVLGRGGMGVVFRARQITLNRQVAIKTVLLSQYGQTKIIPRFEKEAVTIASLRHPNIVTAYDFGRQAERLFLVMELLEGHDLEVLIRERQRLDEPTAWAIARQAACGLAHAAELGIVHRDIKPANLLLVQPPAGFQLPPGVPLVKITDFGLVLQAGDLESPRLTMAGTSLGTPAYMAPEQLASSAVDCRADIYALGATVYHMLTGHLPFAGGSLWQLMSSKMQGHPPDLETVGSPATVALLREMMATDPEQRLAGYPLLLERIDHLAAAPTVPCTPIITARRQRAPRRLRPRWLVAVGLVLLLGVLAAVGWHWNRRTPLQPPMAVVTGQVQALYDGSDITQWTPLAGAWEAGKDNEGGSILSGKGIVRRALPAFANYRLSFHVDLHAASAVQLHFGIRPPEAGQQLRYVLVLAREGVSVASATSDSDTLQVLSEKRPAPELGVSADSPSYHEVIVERIGDQWSASYDGNVLARLPAQPPELPEFRLAAQGGSAYFEEVTVTELLPASKP